MDTVEELNGTYFYKGYLCESLGDLFKQVSHNLIY
jgi:hypothetical protein